MSGPNVVDKAKMVFHYVAKIASRPSNSSDIQETNTGREMKVCFRHSKHSIKCDMNAPCLECDSGLKLYSYEQCRRHLDVVRSEKRFESIEVDRSENMIEKLSDIDENGKKMSQFLEIIATKQELIAKQLSDFQQNMSKNETFIPNTHPKHELEEEKISRETMNCTLKEISKNSLKSSKKQEEICEQLSQCHSLLIDINSNGIAINNNHIEGQKKFCEINSNLTTICGEINENTNHLKETTNSYKKSLNELQKQNEKLFEEILEIKRFVSRFEISLKQELNEMRNEFISELQLTRNELIESQTQLRSQLTSAIDDVKQELKTLNHLSQSFVSDLKESLPEKLMDVFGGILMLSADHNRKMDNNDESGSGVTTTATTTATAATVATANSSSFASQYHLNNKNEY